MEGWPPAAPPEVVHGSYPRHVRQGEPVFYLLENGQLAFWGPCVFFRVPYQKRTLDYVPGATLGDQTKSLDLAESIFGTVNAGERKKDADVTGPHRGRVFFEDARCEQKAPFLDGGAGRRWPGVLSAPKPESYQHYLVQPKDLGSSDNDRKKNLLAYDSTTPDDSGMGPATALRGFKRYWHRAPVPDSPGAPPADEASGASRDQGLYLSKPSKHLPQFTCIRPVRRGVLFRGRIRFENLSSLELGALLTALHLPASYRHHLGMGKSLGLGSVNIDPTVRLIDPIARYRSLSSGGWIDKSEVSARISSAREEFRKTMITHHNRAVNTDRLPETADLWEIPRLKALRLMLEWTHRPRRQDTCPQSLREFKSRKVLPSPFGVRDLKAPQVDADVPIDGTAAQPGTTTGRSSPVAAPNATAATFVMGRITSFTTSGIQVAPEGRPPERLPVSVNFFPLELWKKLIFGNFPRGRIVRIFYEGGRIVRVEPA